MSTPAPAPSARPDVEIAFLLLFVAYLIVRPPEPRAGLWRRVSDVCAGLSYHLLRVGAAAHGQYARIKMDEIKESQRER